MLIFKNNILKTDAKGNHTYLKCVIVTQKKNIKLNID